MRKHAGRERERGRGDEEACGEGEREEVAAPGG
jgi:hypothetical protein